jgi:hypothetical protein
MALDIADFQLPILIDLSDHTNQQSKIKNRQYQG